MSLLPLKFPPGMYRNGTEYESAGRWYTGNLVRWQNGTLKPIGGWQNQLTGGAVLTGLARGILTWRDNSGFKHIMIGTNSKLYHGSGGIYTDSTPSGLNTGRSDSILGPGYGAGPYGATHYGTARPTSGGTAIVFDAATWSMDVFGQIWIGVLTSDNKLYQFDPSTGLVTVVTNSPTCNAAFVTNESAVMALQAGMVARQVRWCSIGDQTVWTAASTNSAGSENLTTDSAIQCGRKVGTQNLIWTTTDVHLANFIGAPDYYGFERKAEGSGIVGPNAVAIANDVAYWWGFGGFFSYNGLVEPLPCDVQDYVFNNINWTQATKIYASPNTQFNEVQWDFPSLNSTENDSYVIFNYKEKLWYYGAHPTYARTCREDRGTFDNPIGVAPSGAVYDQEIGLLADGASRNGIVFAQSGPGEIGNGDKVIYSNLMLPDATNGSAIEATLLTRQAPQGPQSSYGPYGLTPNAEGYVPVRFSGRQASVRIDQVQDLAWELGTQRFEAVQGGRR